MQKGCAVVIAFVVLFFIGTSSAFEFIRPTKRDKCPVCGMFVYKYPQWTAEIVFKDGTYVVFDGPKDMFKYYFNINKYGRDREEIDHVCVMDYYTTNPVDAKEVYFIRGSDVYGPMGEELVPVKGERAAEMFMKDHKGKEILRFDEVTPEDIPGMQMHEHRM